MLAVRVPSELKDMVDVDKRTNQDVVEAALWREFGGEKKSALETRAREKRNRIEQIQQEKEKREEELEDHQKELRAIESKIESVEVKQDAKEKREEKLFESLTSCPANPNNSRVIKVAKELGESPEKVVQRMVEEFDKERADGTSDNGLRSL